MFRIFGIGIGLFLLAIIWPSALLFCFISNRAKAPISTIGVIVIITVTIFTIILILIPRASDHDLSDAQIDDKQGLSERQSDWMFVLRPIIIIFNLIALLFGFVMIYNKFICKQITRPKLSELKLKTVKPFVK